MFVGAIFISALDTPVMIGAVSTAMSGVAAASAQFDRSAQAVVSAGTPGAPSDSVDLSEAALAMINAQAGLQINIAMLKLATKADQHVLDILA